MLGGERRENEKLRLGVFTQDLAQELDTMARAVDLVTAHAREGKFGDITISDQDARNVMGRLGLGGEKPLRLVGSLSGGEKARVALSMFALKASNLLLLDEVSYIRSNDELHLFDFALLQKIFDNPFHPDPLLRICDCDSFVDYSRVTIWTSSVSTH